MTHTEIVAGIYTCLEMLRIEREDLHAYWCNFLYTEDGDIHAPAWTEHKLMVMENDVAYYA